MKRFVICLLGCIMLTGCYTLKEAVVEHEQSMENYKYVFITPTKSLTSSSGGVYSNQYGVSGSTVKKSVNPSDVIAGIFMKKGFIII